MGFLSLMFLLSLSGQYFREKLSLNSIGIPDDVSVELNISTVGQNLEIIFQERKLKMKRFCSQRRKKNKRQQQWPKELVRDGRILHTKGNFTFCMFVTYFFSTSKLNQLKFHLNLDLKKREVLI